MALRERRHSEIIGDRAYVVMPTTYTYKEHESRLLNRAVPTFALQKVSAVEDVFWPLC